MQLQRSLAPEDPLGYRLQTSDDGAWQAEASYQNTVGDYTLSAAQREGASALRAGVSGGVVTLGGGVFASRRISDSFALVQVPGYADVRVYKDNQLIGRTDASGNALVPSVRAYEVNPVSIEALDLPMDARVDALQRDALAYYRSGVLLRFPLGPLHRGRSPKPGRLLLGDGVDRTRLVLALERLPTHARCCMLYASMGMSCVARCITGAQCLVCRPAWHCPAPCAG